MTIVIASRPDPDAALAALAAEARACTLCAAHLPLGPRPIFRVSTTARILIASQAPGTKAHLEDRAFADASGIRLRAWLGVTEQEFYDQARIAILPMGLCYPGRLPNGGDAPPRPECAPRWRPRLLALMPALELTLLVGGYAIADALGRGPMTERVRAWRDYLPQILPLPHPSWRTGHWERRNPWFADELLPELRTRMRTLVAARPCSPVIPAKAGIQAAPAVLAARLDPRFRGGDDSGAFQSPTPAPTPRSRRR